MQLSYNGDNLSVTFDIRDDITADVTTPLGLGVVRSLARKFRLASLSGTQDDILSQSRTQRHDWCSPPVDVTISAHCYRVFTGCGSLNELHSGWRYSPTAASMVQHPTTYLDNCSESLMSARGGDFVPRRPLHWSLHGLFEPPSVTGLSLLPRLQFGTAFRKQSVFQHLWPCSESH